MTTDGTPEGTTLTTLVEFTGTSGDYKGSFPDADLFQDIDGKFYGTTSAGGALDYGTIFIMSFDGVTLPADFDTLVEFTKDGASNRGSLPIGNFVKHIDGNFYGTTNLGGASNDGTVFKMATDGTPEGTTLTTLVEFAGIGTNGKGLGPRSTLLEGVDGNFYVTTRKGGVEDSGTIYQMTPDGTVTTLVEFTDVQGALGSLVLPDNGNVNAIAELNGAVVVDKGRVLL